MNKQELTTIEELTEKMSKQKQELSDREKFMLAAKLEMGTKQLIRRLQVLLAEVMDRKNELTYSANEYDVIIRSITNVANYVNNRR